MEDKKALIVSSPFLKKRELARTQGLLEGLDTRITSKNKESSDSDSSKTSDSKTTGARARERALFIVLILGLVLTVFLKTIFPVGIAFALTLFLKPKSSSAKGNLYGKREKNFEKDYPSFLITLASSIGSGIDPLVAMLEAEELFDNDAVITQEIQKLKIKIEQGYTEEKAIREFAHSISHPDLKLFRTAFLLARNEGSSLKLCLQRLAKTTRTRQSFRRKMRSAVAIQRISTMGIAGIALLMGGGQFASSSELRREVFSDPTGILFFGLGVSLILIGLFMSYQMTKPKY